MPIVLQSFAKVNLGLWLLGKRPDGYHEIFTPMVKISLADYIEIKPSNRLEVKTNASIPEEENLVYKGLKLFEKKTGISQKWEIFIDKRIPIGGGLGGGSSNLATVLKFVNDFFGKPLREKELSDLLLDLSSDAPFFLCEGIGLATGRGEKVECFPLQVRLKITLFVPEGISSPTGEIYAKVEPSTFVSKEKLVPVKKLLEKGLLEELFQIAENPLGDIFLRLHPQVAEDIDLLSKVCYKKFIVSGSGSSFYTVGSLEGCYKVIDSLKGRYKIYSLVSL